MGIKQVGLYVVRSYVALGLFFYYKKIVIKGKDRVPKQGSVLFLSNHQNALMDALIIATKSGRFCYYLTRASVFNKPLIATILKGLNMLPVYRVRDGWQTISNNKDIFKRCTALLYEQEAIVVFPEGNHSLKRKVRPLSKGFTRLVFDTLEAHPQLDLQLLPLGLNYEDAEAFADCMLLQIGAPILAKYYFEEDGKPAIKQLKTDVQSQIQKLTTHITSSDYDDMADHLYSQGANFLNPEGVNYYIQNKEILEGFSKKPNAFLGFKSLFKYALIINVLPVYIVWKNVLQPKIKEAEFIATFRFALAITLIPIWLILVCISLGVFVGWNDAMGWLVGVLAISLLAVKL